MLRPLALAGIAALVLTSTPASALDITANDYGGEVGPYASRAKRADRRGEPVRFGDVECDSSCTLLLAARNACVSPNAVFGFHAPWYGTPQQGVVDPRMVEVFASSYKPALRRLFYQHVRSTGGAAPGPLLKLTGAQLASLGYRLCGQGETVVASRARPAARFGPVEPHVMAQAPRGFEGPFGPFGPAPFAGGW
ncbi:MAG TPA: hypothetical protein VK446_02670 [Methylocystis sp.]|nr:hypothetical protein [Methylocystis sp.]